MEMAIASVFCSLLLLICPTTSQLPDHIADELERALKSSSFDKNVSNDGAKISIQITDHPGGHILLINPEESLATTPTCTCQLNHNIAIGAINKSIDLLAHQMQQISSKLTHLEGKLEKHLIHDLKNSPNVFFVAPKAGDTAVERLKGQKIAPIEWIISASPTVTSSPTPPIKNLFFKNDKSEKSPKNENKEQIGKASQPQIDLLNRSKRKSKGNSSINKQKNLSFCAKIIPVGNSDEKRENQGNFRLRRIKRTKRDVKLDKSGNSEENTSGQVNMAEWLLVLREYQERLKEIRSSALKTWLASKIVGGSVKVDDVKVFYGGDEKKMGDNEKGLDYWDLLSDQRAISPI